MLLSVFDYYSEYGLAKPGSVPFPAASAGLSQWLWVPTVELIAIYLALLFPDGRLPSGRWLPLAWLSGAVIVLLSVAEGLSPGPLAELGEVRNPFGLEGQPWVADASNAILALFLLCILGSMLSLILRYRRSRGERREQIKWIAFAASFVGLGFVSAMVGGLIYYDFAPQTWGSGDNPPLWFALLVFSGATELRGVPIEVGIAVLKYRLHDIDLIINRTLVYGALTSSVIGIYVFVVGYLGVVFRTDDLLVSLLATGLVAVLFAPLRERLQRGVNRLMYGERDDPYAVVSRLGKRLEAILAPDAVRLTTDLQCSRERLVAAREEERRRLRRDLHDGLGAQLAALNVQAGLWGGSSGATPRPPTSWWWSCARSCALPSPT
jgi:signal transduction histidine kinase